MDCSTPGFPVHHQIPEFTKTHVHWVGDAIQTFHSVSSPSPPAFNLSQHQDLFKWVSSSHQVAKVLEVQLQNQYFQWIVRVDFLYTIHGVLKARMLKWFQGTRDSQESSLTPQFKSINSLVLSLLYGPTLTSIHDYWKNHSFDYMNLCWQSNVSAFFNMLSWEHLNTGTQVKYNSTVCSSVTLTPTSEHSRSKYH